jgi:hypothetical protein
MRAVIFTEGRVAGVRIVRPWRLDITNLVMEFATRFGGHAEAPHRQFLAAFPRT